MESRLAQREGCFPAGLLGFPAGEEGKVAASFAGTVFTATVNQPLPVCQ